MYLVTGLSGCGKSLYCKYLTTSVKFMYKAPIEIVHLDYLNGYLMNPAKYAHLLEESPILKSYVNNVLYPNPPYTDIDWDNDPKGYIRDFILWLNEKEKFRNNEGTIYIVEGIQIFNVLDPCEFLINPIKKDSYTHNKLHVIDYGFLRCTFRRLKRRFGKPDGYQTKEEPFYKKLEHMFQYDINPAQFIEWIRFIKFKMRCKNYNNEEIRRAKYEYL